MILPNSLYHADCLTLLERIDDGVARTIYLDPPWFSQPFVGTRGDGSRVANGLRDYLDNFARVLQQCHRILAEDGSIIVHAEPSLGQKFALLLGQVFRDNHLDDYILPKFRMGKGLRHATLLHYGKSQNALRNEIRRPVEVSEREWNPDDDPRGPWRAVELTTRMERPALQYEWRGHYPPSGRSWRYRESDLDRLAEEGRIYFGGPVPQLKVYLSERQSIPVGTIWDDLQPLRGDSAERVSYSTQQPVALAERVVLLTSNPGDLIIDPYCGSGTSLIAAHRQDRRWIGCDASTEAIKLTRSRLAGEGVDEGAGWRAYSTPDLAAVEAKPTFLRRVITMVEDLNAAEVLIAEGENDFVERKISAYWNTKTGQKDNQNKEKLIRSMAAFLNSRDGGTVLIGVADDGTLPGLTDDYAAANPQRPGRDTYELWMRQTLGDRLGRELIAFVKITFDEVRGQDVCIIRVAAGNRPACNMDKLPIRRGNQTVDLSLKEAIEYSRTRWPL